MAPAPLQHQACVTVQAMHYNTPVTVCGSTDNGLNVSKDHGRTARASVSYGENTISRPRLHRYPQRLVSCTSTTLLTNTIPTNKRSRDSTTPRSSSLRKLIYLCYTIIAPRNAFPTAANEYAKSSRGSESSEMQRGVRRLSTGIPAAIPEELLVFQKGRGRAERADSFTVDMLEQRKLHYDRIQERRPSKYHVDLLKSQGFGQKRLLPGMYTSHDSYSYFDEADAHVTGAGGHAQHLASASGKPWPIFKHLLPEIVFAGHSNSGKSTLVNAMIGVKPRLGPAKVSDRAGWTDQICFYQIGRKPPLLTLVDLPGYGHAVADTEHKQAWKTMIREYLSTRRIVAKCYILVDCTRGLCVQDFNQIRLLDKVGVEWGIVLTKCDLLTAEDLQGSRIVVAEDLVHFTKVRASNNPSLRRGDNIPPVPADAAFCVREEVEKLFNANRITQVSASTGAGIGTLFRSISKTASESMAPFVSDRSVREHVNAALLRQESTRCEEKVRSAIKISNRVRNQIK